MAEPNSNVHLLNAFVERDYIEDDHYRFLVDRKHVKYVRAARARGTLPDNSRTPNSLPQHLPPFPPGPWNRGHVACDPETGAPVSTRTVTEKLCDVANLRHPERLDHLEFTLVEPLKSYDHLPTHVHRATHPRFAGTVVLKFAPFSGEGAFLSEETDAYRDLKGTGIGPAFLGHLLEGDRVIGFVLEDVEGRHPRPEDLKACRAALGRLHAVGCIGMSL